MKVKKHALDIYIYFFIVICVQSIVQRYVQQRLRALLNTLNRCIDTLSFNLSSNFVTRHISLDIFYR